MESKIFPQNIGAERAVLGAIISFSCSNEILGVLKSETFYDPRNKEVFSAIKKLRDNGRPVDIISVSEELKAEKSNVDATYIVELTNCVATSAGLQNHVNILLDKADRRSLISLADCIMKKAYDDAMDISDVKDESANEICQMTLGKALGDFSMRDAKEQLLERIKKAQEGVELGVPTGFPDIDRGCGGFSLGDLVVIGADTSVGKTSLAWTFAINAAQKGNPIGYISLEMAPYQLFGRAVARETHVNASRIVNPSCAVPRKLNQDELGEINASAIKIETLPIYIADIRTVEGICAKVRLWATRKKIKGVYIDYLQILSASGQVQNETSFLTNVARRFQRLAKELNIFVCVLSQLSRASVGDYPTPGLQRIRGSQEIPGAADTVIMISRPEQDGTKYPKEFEQISTRGTALIEIKKGRNIGTFKFVCRYDAEHTTFFPIKGNPPLASLDSTTESVSRSALYIE